MSLRHHNLPIQGKISPSNAKMAVRALVIGGTSGIGFGIACRLAAQDASSSIIISGRTKPHNLPHSNLDFRPLDATSMRQIKQYTDDLKSSLTRKLDFLVMTQGIMTTDGRTETPEGIDRKMALHYYGKQLLIRELLPVLEDDAKVIIVFDALTGNPSKLVWEDLGLKTHFNLANAANHCMSMNDAMVQYFAAEQKTSLRNGGTAKRHFTHAFPGGVNTGLHRELPWYLRHAGKALLAVAGVSAETCAKHLLTGVEARSQEDKTDGRFWSTINSKGASIKNKASWTEGQIGLVAKHTWEVVDGALGDA